MIEANHMIQFDYYYLFVKILHHLIYNYDLLVIVHLYVFEKMLYRYQMSKKKNRHSQLRKLERIIKQTKASVFNNVIGTGG
jgi:hypothetical protein